MELADTTVRDDHPPRRKPLLYLLACAALAAGLALFGAALVLLVRHGATVRDFGWSAEDRDGGFVVSSVDAHGPAADRLRPGDEILAINGDARASVAGPLLKRSYLPGNATYVIRVARGPTRHEYQLPLPTRQEPGSLALVLSVWIVSAVWFGVAGLVGLLKPDRPIAWFAFVAGIAEGLALLRMALLAVAPTAPAARVLYGVAFPFMPLQLALGYYFYYRFPPSVPRGRLWSLVGWSLLGWGGVLAALLHIPWSVATAAGENAVLALVSRFPQHFERLEALDTPFYPVAALAIAAVIARNHRLVSEPDERRRLKWVVWGSLAGLGPFIVIWVTGVVRIAMGLPFVGTAWLVLGNLATVAIPISFAYAIVKHRVFDISFVVRQGLQYLLARNALRVMLWLPVLWLVYQVVADRHVPLGEALSRHSIYLYLIAAAALSLRFRTQLTDWLDRRFFREAYDRDRILTALLDDLEELENPSEMARLVSRELEAAVHPQVIYLWYRDTGKPQRPPAESSGLHLADIVIDERSELVRLMDSAPRVLEVPVPPEHRLSATECAWLERLNVALVVPITGTDRRLLGLLMIGPKKSEEPYTAADRKIFQAIARQLGVVRENVELRERVDRDRRIRHEVLARLEGGDAALLRECPTCGRCFDGAVQTCPSDGAELTLTLPVERVIDGKYRLDRLIGRGGMGAVYEAADVRLDRKVALKLMFSRAFGDRVAVRRFEREARAVARLNHPNIVAIYDYGSVGAEGAYLVMELARGVTLRAVLNRRAVIEPPVLAPWLDQMLAAIGAAHQRGVIHRDLKPENVLIVLGPNGDLVKILDFGLAKVRGLDATDTTLTIPGMVMGTMGYMAPEQLTGTDVDERADIFAIGVIAVEALTGRRPFTGRTATELLVSIVNEPLRLPGERNEVRRLEDVLQRCLVKDPAARFESIDALREALIAALDACPTLVPADMAESDRRDTNFLTSTERQNNDIKQSRPDVNVV